jgi:dipicolinate synthase subunit A
VTEKLAGLEICLLGGDAREVEAALFFQAWGARLTVCGLNSERFREKVHVTDDPVAAVAQAQLVLAPVLGTDGEGRVYALQKPAPVLNETVLRSMPANCPLFIGLAQPWLRSLAVKVGRKLVEFRERDDFAILNSVPSAEGAIAMAMERMPITIHGAQAFVLGFGRTGNTLARMLHGIGAHVWVAARRPEVLAQIAAHCYHAVPFNKLADYIQLAEVIFNTVPALVLDRSLLSRLPPGTVVIDLASYPGGVDFPSAAQLGIPAVLAPGLPARVAPHTAGLIVAETVLRLFLPEYSPPVITCGRGGTWD